MNALQSPAESRIGDRLAIAFWLALFAVISSFVGALVAALLRVDTTAVEAGFLGAFFGSLPMIALPTLARITFGEGSRLADRSHVAFRAFSLTFVVLVATVGERYQTPWWHHSIDHRPLALTGLVAAMLATWFTPHFPIALRLWTRQRSSLPSIPPAGSR